MCVKNSKILFLSVLTFFCSIKLCLSTEYVPVFLWDTVNTPQLSPALHRITENSFKESLSDKLKSNPLVVVFVEETLSPEDFSRHDQDGKTLFKSLHNYLKTSNGAYKPYVQNPVGAIKQLGKATTEISISSLLRNFNVFKNQIVIVDLNDAKEDENRSEMLKRHDSVISKIFEEFSESNDNILGIYTSKHTSWITPEYEHNRNVRSLLQEKTPEKSEEVAGLITDNSYLLLYSSQPMVSTDDGINFAQIAFQTTKCTPTEEGDEINLELAGNNSETYNFIISIKADGYWTLSNVSSGENHFSIPHISAPLGFSYHCHDVLFVSGKQMLKLPAFQIQPFTPEEKEPVEKKSFGDPYDCVGFTTIPIWTGIFVTIILLLILTFGITMMMDIRTMDKFDDAKGKTITINVAE